MYIGLAKKSVSNESVMPYDWESAIRKNLFLIKQ